MSSIDLPAKTTLAQSDDVMFERNIAITASKMREVCVVTTFREITGFIAGLDKVFVQVCVSESGDQVLVNRTHLVEVQETGNELGGIASDTMRRRVEDRVKTFAAVSKSFLQSH